MSAAEISAPRSNAETTPIGESPLIWSASAQRTLRQGSIFPNSRLYSALKLLPDIQAVHGRPGGDFLGGKSATKCPCAVTVFATATKTAETN